MQKENTDRIYTLKTHEECGISIPSEIYQQTANCFYLLTGKGENEVNKELFKHPSPDAGMLILEALNMNSAQMMATSLMIGYTPIGQDTIWLSICRAKLNWFVNNPSYIYNCQEGQVDTYIKKQMELNEIIDCLEPAAQKEYFYNCVPYARFGKTPESIDLGINIKDNIVKKEETQGFGQVE